MKKIFLSVVVFMAMFLMVRVSMACSPLYGLVWPHAEDAYLNTQIELAVDESYNFSLINIATGNEVEVTLLEEDVYKPTTLLEANTTYQVLAIFEDGDEYSKTFTTADSIDENAPDISEMEISAEINLYASGERFISSGMCFGYDIYDENLTGWGTPLETHYEVDFTIDNIIDEQVYVYRNVYLLSEDGSRTSAYQSQNILYPAEVGDSVVYQIEFEDRLRNMNPQGVQYTFHLNGGVSTYDMVFYDVITGSETNPPDDPPDNPTDAASSCSFISKGSKNGSVPFIFMPVLILALFFVRRFTSKIYS